MISSNWYLGNLGTLAQAVLGLLGIACFGIAGVLWVRREYSRLFVTLRTFSETVIEVPRKAHPFRREGDRA